MAFEIVQLILVLLANIKTVSIVLGLMYFLWYSMNYIETNKFNFMQHLNEWNHFEFKPKIELALYENWEMSWFGWMKVYYDLA